MIKAPIRSTACCGQRLVLDSSRTGVPFSGAFFERWLSFNEVYALALVFALRLASGWCSVDLLETASDTRAYFFTFSALLVIVGADCPSELTGRGRNVVFNFLIRKELHAIYLVLRGSRSSAAGLTAVAVCVRKRSISATHDPNAAAVYALTHTLTHIN